MDAHAVPQNVTSFEFHLVGDMTLKQFGYLALGLGAAYLIFVFWVSKLPLITWPLIVLTAATGVAFAFLPIQERPLDHWVKAYFGAIFRPTQRQWHSDKLSKNNDFMKNRLNIYLTNLETHSNFNVSNNPLLNPPKISATNQYSPKTQPVITPSLKKEFNENPQPATSQPPGTPSSMGGASLSSTSLSSRASNEALPPQIAQSQVPPNDTGAPPKETLPSNEELEKTVELAKKAQEIQFRIIQTERELTQIKIRSAAPGADPSAFTDEFRRALANLQALTEQASEISKQMAIFAKAPVSQMAAGPTVIIPAPKKNLNTNIKLTTTPNIINGIVTDSSNNYLEGVIVVTHDKEGLPVRALKTNKLGQFVAATPLPNGIYTLTFEKDNLLFDNIQIELNDGVQPPLVVSAKKVSVG